MLSTTRVVIVSLALGLVLSGAGRARAADTDLAKVLPGPSVLYIGWRGAEAAGPAYQRTALGRMMAEPEFARLCEAVCPRAKALIKQEMSKGDAAQLHGPLMDVLGMLWRHPGAVNLMRFVLKTDGVDVQAAAAWHLGSDAERFEAALKPLQGALFETPEGGESPLKPVTIGELELTQFSPGGGMPLLTWGRVGEYFIVTAGRTTPKKVIDSLTGKSEIKPLIEDEDFAAARKGLAGQPGTVVLNWHLSIAEIVRRLPLVATIIDLQQATEGGRKNKGRRSLGVLVGRSIRTLGLRKFKSLSGTVSLADNGFRFSSYLHAPGAKGGLMTLYQQKLLTDADLAVVPRDANLFCAVNLDLHGLYQEMMSALKEIDPNMHEGWQDALAECEETAGVKLVDDLLAPLDDGWCLYNASSSGGIWGMGLTLVIETKDAAHAERSMTALARAIVKAMGGTRVKLPTYKTAGGQTVHFVDAKYDDPYRLIAPAWGTAGRHLVIGLYPQIVASTLERLGAGGDALAAGSILKNPDFAAQRKRLPDNAILVGYVDTKDLLGPLYRLLLPVASVLAGELAKAGFEVDVSYWPRAQTFERHLFGMVASVAPGDQGVLGVSHSPLPLPTPVVSPPAVLTGIGVTAAVIHMVIKAPKPTATQPSTTTRPADKR